MYILTKEGDEITIIFSPDENLSIGDTLKIDGLIVQVIDIQFANLPGILEHILRKSLIPKANVKEQIPEQVKSILDSLVDQRVAITKIRGRIIQTKKKDGEEFTEFKQGYTEFTLSRANPIISKLPYQELMNILGLNFDKNSDYAKTISTEPQPFNIPIERLGINLITGMKGSGKSYAAKKLLLKLIDQGILSIVFDLNAEYINLWKDEKGKPNSYQDRIKIMTPHLPNAIMNNQPFMIPLNELTYDDFANFLNIRSDTAMYNQLVQFWHEAGNREFDLNDFEGYVNKIPESDLRVRVIKAGLMDRINVAKALNLFGPSNFIKLIKELQKTGGAVIIDLSKVTSFVRAIIVDFILRKLALLGQTKEIKPLSIFLEEAHLYVTQENIKNLVTRMRHFGIFPTFITNNPSTLPSEVFIQLDNLIAFRMKNEDELRHLAKVGLIDSDSIQALRNLEDKQCLLVGDISSNYPMFLQIEQQTGIMMGGETRKLLS
jgi:hypothetical protein